MNTKPIWGRLGNPITLITFSLAIVCMAPQPVAGQTCGAIGSNNTWTGADWRVDSNNSGDFDTGDDPCPSPGYPDAGDDAVITTDVRISLDTDLTGNDAIGSLTLQSGTTADASGTALIFGFLGTGYDLETTGDVTNNSGGSNNGLRLTSSSGTGTLTVGGIFTNSGVAAGDNSNVQLIVGSRLDNSGSLNLSGADSVNVGLDVQNDGVINFSSGGQFVVQDALTNGSNNSNATFNASGADSVAVSNGITNDGTNAGSNTGKIDLSSITDTVTVAGNTFRNRGTVDISSSIVKFDTDSDLALNGDSFNAGSPSNNNSSTVVFSGTSQPITGSGSAGDDGPDSPPDATLAAVELINQTLVDPGIDIEILKSLTVNLNSQWGSGSSETANLFFEGTDFSVLQDNNDSTNDAQYFSSGIFFKGSGTTNVEGEVFSDVRVETTLDLNGTFTIDGFLEHLTSTITVDQGDELELDRDAESNGVLTVNGVLSFTGLGTTAGNDKVQDFFGTGDWTLDGVELREDGTDVRFNPNESDLIDVGSLLIQSNTSLGVVGNLGVAQNLTANGDLSFPTQDDGKLVLNGSGQQDISTNSPLAINVLEIAKSGSQDADLTSGTEIDVTKILELSSGSFDVSAGTLTLKSSQSSHAVLTYGSGTITGAVTAEREFTTQNWLFLANPEGTSYNSFLRNGNQNNLWIQGHSGSDVPDASFANTNLFEYNEQQADSSRDNSWARTQISGLADPATRGQGFILYPFVDDDFDGSGEGNTKTVNIQAEPTTSTQFNAFPVTATDRNNSTTSDTDDLIDDQEGWNLLGNPFLTNISWNALDRTNIDDVVYVYEPASGYASYNGTTSDGADSTFADAGIIGPFQAFFVKATNDTDPSTASYSLDLPDITKAQRDSIGGDPFLSKSAGRDERVLALNLSLSSLSEETKFTFRRDGQMEKDVADAYHLESPRSSGSLQSANFLSLYSVLGNGNALSINNLPYELDNAATIPVQPELRGCDGSDPYVGEVAISLSGTRNIPSGWRLVLEDLKTDEEINLRQRAAYSFTLESSTSGEACSKSLTSKKASDSQQISPLPSPEVTSRSMAKDGQPDTRFTLRIEPKSSASPPTTPTMPPVEYGRFEGRTEGKAAVLTWTTTRERDNDGFYVQRKTEDGSFSSLEDAFVEGQGTTTASQEYSYRVENLDVGTHTFRLKQVGTEGATTYSDPIEVKVRLSGAFELSTYPNPARTQATVEVAVRKRSDVTLSLYNTLGQEIRTVYRGPMPAEQTKRVRIDVQDLSSGVYFLRFEGEGTTGTRRMTVVK